MFASSNSNHLVGIVLNSLNCAVRMGWIGKFQLDHRIRFLIVQR